eukprot:6196502-Pleurochrysis_carterae.AAC.3
MSRMPANTSVSLSFPLELYVWRRPSSISSPPHPRAPINPCASALLVRVCCHRRAFSTTTVRLNLHTPPPVFDLAPSRRRTTFTAHRSAQPSPVSTRPRRRTSQCLSARITRTLPARRRSHAWWRSRRPRPRARLPSRASWPPSASRGRLMACITWRRCAPRATMPSPAACGRRQGAP